MTSIAADNTIHITDCVTQVCSEILENLAPNLTRLEQLKNLATTLDFYDLEESISHLLIATESVLKYAEKEKVLFVIQALIDVETLDELQKNRVVYATRKCANLSLRSCVKCLAANLHSAGFSDQLDTDDKQEVWSQVIQELKDFQKGLE